MNDATYDATAFTADLERLKAASREGVLHPMTITNFFYSEHQLRNFLVALIAKEAHS